MAVEKGSVSVQMENLFPLIKKWLYSEKDIFARELTTNSLDAISKLKHLKLCGEFKSDAEENFEIHVKTDKENKTVTFSDNGLGMTAEEIKKYISEVAFSGASDFIDKYKNDDKDSGIIGHFGLGFYSSFIIADYVEIDSLSYREGASAAHWKCFGNPDYEISEGKRDKRGTDVIIHVAEDESDYLEEYRMRHVLSEYCSFMPVPVFLNGKRINEQKALWNERPADIEEKEYIDFYRHLYPFEDDPIFWVHINVEFPIRAKGILYFPKLTHELDNSKGKIKFYYNSVYVSDNLKDLIPPFLLNLRGVIDCPDMPLNVSRSYLQQDPVMKKLTAHITRKVSDELSSLFKSDREKYERYWEDINPFIKVGMMEDDKFFDSMKPALIFKKAGGEGYEAFDSFMESKPDKVFYASDEKGQSFYIGLAKNDGKTVFVADSWIDLHFIPFLERKYAGTSFVRVDSEVAESALSKDEGEAVDSDTGKTFSETVTDVFKKALDIPGLSIRAEKLKDASVPAIAILKEQDRRMREMFTMFRREEPSMPAEHEIVVNMSNDTVRRVVKAASSENVSDSVNLVIWQIYDLAVMSQRPLFEMRAETYAKNSSKLLELYAANVFAE